MTKQAPRRSAIQTTATLLSAIAGPLFVSAGGASPIILTAIQKRLQMPVERFESLLRAVGKAVGHASFAEVPRTKFPFKQAVSPQAPFLFLIFLEPLEMTSVPCSEAISMVTLQASEPFKT